MTSQRIVVIDTGSKTCRAGFHDNISPVINIPTVTGDASAGYLKLVPTLDQKVLVGHEALSKRAIYKLRYPVHKGSVENWTSVETLWDHIILNELKCNPEETSLVVTIPPSQSPEYRSTMLKTLFENMKVSSLLLSDTATSALLATNRSTAVVLDCGHEHTTCGAFSDGNLLSETLFQTDFGGKNLTEYLVQLMAKRDIMWTTFNEMEFATKIKERHCFVSLNTTSETPTSSPILHSPTDEQEKFTIDAERFQVGEALFDPNVTGSAAMPIDSVVETCINRAPETTRHILYQNIILIGGTSLMPGLAPRLKAELSKRVGTTTDINIIELDNRHHLSWIGAAKQATLPEYKASFVECPKSVNFIG